MKTFPGAGSRRMTYPRNKCSHQPLSREMHQIAHHLFNQLSVINLCTFKLQAKSRGNGDHGASDDLQLLQRSVEEASLWAERLSEIILQGVPSTEAKKAAPGRPVDEVNSDQANKVVRLFDPGCRQRRTKH